jgi:hypothetical protein
MVAGDGLAVPELIGMKHPGNSYCPCRCCLKHGESATGNGGTYYMPNTAAEIQGTGLKIRNNLREQIDLVIEAGGDYLRDCGECTFFKNPTPNFTHTPVISHHHPRVISSSAQSYRREPPERTVVATARVIEQPAAFVLVRVLASSSSKINALLSFSGGLVYVVLAGVIHIGRRVVIIVYGSSYEPHCCIAK